MQHPHLKTPLLILGLFLYAFFGQGMRGLYKPDEGRYTCVALNMIDSGDYIFPRLNDERPHFTKPPLTYWAIAGSIAAFGRNESAARIPSALAFAATVLLIAAMGRRLCPRNPYLAPVIYATFPLAYVAANIVTTDTLLTFWEALAMFGFIEWWHRRGDPGRARWSLLMWAAFGFAFMTKGPPGLIPLLPMIVFMLWRGERGDLGAIFAWHGLVVFTFIGTFWYVAVCISKPELIGYFFGSELYDRIVTGAHHRNAQWYGAFVVYIPVLLLGAFPWNLILIRKLLSRPANSDSAFRHPHSAFLSLSFFLPLVLFFLARSRLALYLVPLFVPLSLILARQFDGIDLKRGYWRYAVFFWVAIMASTRIAGGVVKTSKNTIVLADAIRREISWSPQEIVFVNIGPDYGLQFYLDCEIENVSLAPEPNTETLEQEISTPEPGQLFIVSRRNEHRLLGATPPTGYKWVRLGNHENSFFYAYEKI